MADNKKKQSNQPVSNRTGIIMVVLICLTALFVGSQFFALNAADQRQTDALVTSEFVQAVEQGRVQSVVYAASDYTVSTAGAAAVNAFNSAFDTMNALMASTPDPSGGVRGGVGTQTLEPATLGAEHNYTSTYVGADSLGELVAGHPEIEYQVTLPTNYNIKIS